MSKRPDTDAGIIVQSLLDIAKAARQPTGAEPESATGDREEVSFTMSNLDQRIDPGMEEALRAGHVWGRHTAWEFFGRVWFEDGEFREEVWRYRAPAARFAAPTLRELMELVNEEYGWE